MFWKADRITPRSIGYRYQSFGGTCCLHLEIKAARYMWTWGRNFLENVDNGFQYYGASEHGESQIKLLGLSKNNKKYIITGF